MRGTRSSPISIEDSEDEVLGELCDSASSVKNLSHTIDPSSIETYAPISHKRKRDEIRTDYSDAFIQGSSSIPLAHVGESKKARKRRRRLELKALEAAEVLARAQAQRGWYEQMSTVLYGSTGGYDPNLDMNMNMNVLHGINNMPVYSTQDNMRTYSQNVSSGPSEWVSAMALAGSLPDPNGYSNQYQWPPPNSHNSQANPFAPPSRSPSPPALLERVSSPILPTANQFTATVPNPQPIKSIATKRSAQTIGMIPDNEPHSIHGTFHFNPRNLSFFNNYQKPGQVSNLTITNNSYIPNPACTIVMERIPNSYRTIEFVRSWAKQASGVMPVCILVDTFSAKALVEFPSAKFSRKAWESPKLGAEYVGLKPHQMRGKPRVDQIKVWWYRVDGVGAGAGVGEIEEGEIGDEEVDTSQEQRLGHQTKQQQMQEQQEPPRRPESKKARKARLAREKLAKQATSFQRNRIPSRSELGHDLTSGMTDMTNASAPLILPDPSITSPRSPQIPRAANRKNLVQLDLQISKQLDDVSCSPLSRHHRSPSSFGNKPNTGNTGSTPTYIDGRTEVGSRHCPWDTAVRVPEDSMTFSKEKSLTRQVYAPSDVISAHSGKCRSASSPLAADQESAVIEGRHIASTCPPSPPSLCATSTIPQSGSKEVFQGTQGTSAIDITQPISKPSGSNLCLDAVPISTSTSAIVAPSFHNLPTPLTRQPVGPAQPRSTMSPVSTSPPLELAVKATKSQLNVVPLTPLNNSMPTTRPKPIPISIPASFTDDTRVPEPRITVSEQFSSGALIDEKATRSGSTKLAEIKRALMAKQKDLEETIARSKLEMSRLKENVSVEVKEDASMSSSPVEGNKAMEDRLRRLVLQSQKTKSKSTDHHLPVTQSRSSSTSSSVSSTNPSPPVLTPPPGGTDNVFHTMGSIQTFSLEDLAVSFITETISTLKHTITTPTLVSPPIVSPPSVSLIPVVPISQSQPQSQSQVPVSVPGSEQATIKEELAARQKLLEQYIAESRVLMTQLTQAHTKQEKDRLLGLMREKTRLMDEEKEKIANVANGTNLATVSATRVRELDEQKQASKPNMFIRWPSCSLDGGVLIISDDEYDVDEEES